MMFIYEIHVILANNPTISIVSVIDVIFVAYGYTLHVFIKILLIFVKMTNKHIKTQIKSKIFNFVFEPMIDIICKTSNGNPYFYILVLFNLECLYKMKIKKKMKRLRQI